MTLLVLCAGWSTVQAATTKNWQGLGGDNLWNTALNWDLGSPTNTDNVNFTGTTRLVSSNNIIGLNLTGVSFNASGFNLQGSAATTVTNTGGILDNSGSNTNGVPQVMAVSQGITNTSFLTNVNSGTINLATTSTVLSVGGAGMVLLNGIVSGPGQLNVNGDGGTLRLNAANTFAGGATINPNGNVMVGNGTAFPNGAGIGNVTNNGSINLNGISITVNGLYGAGTIDNLSGTATYTITVGNNSTNSAGDWVGTIQNTSGNIGLTKVNTNALTLEGFNSYSGATLISAGTLAIGSGGSIGTTPLITVLPGALLDVSAVGGGFGLNNQKLVAGRGTNGGPNDVVGTIVNNGAIGVYNAGAAGTMTIGGDLTLNSGTVAFDLANTTTPGGPVNDLIVMNGTLNLNGGDILLNPMTGAFGAGTYMLISNATANVNGSAASLSMFLPRGYSGVLDSTTRPGSLLVSMSGSSNPGSLVWNGQTGSDSWDVQVSQDWLKGASADYFYFLDNVTFNDSANGNVTVATGVSPGSTIFNNTATNYALGGSGAISGNGTLTVKGGGTVTLNTPNSYSGNTFVNNGSTLISGVLPVAPHTTLYNGIAPADLHLAGGGFYLSDEQNDTYRVNFNNVIVEPGAGSVAMRSRASSSSYIIQLNSIVRSGVGGTIDFNNIQSKSASPQVGLLITNTTTVNGIAGGGFATIFATDWITPVGTAGGSTAYAGYQTNNASPSSWGALSNVVVTATPGANLNTMVINSLKLPSPATVTINAGQTLTLASGGLLMPANAGGSPVITGGSLLGATNADLIVLQHSPVNSLTIGSVIADNTNNTTTGSALTKSGQGTLILTGNNTYTGPTFVNGPSLQGPTTGLSATAPGAPTLFPAGTLQLGSGGTSGSINTSTGVTNNGILAFNHSDAITFALPISGKGAVKVLGGDVTLTGNNSYSGATTISAGTLRVGAGSTAGSLGNSPSVTDNGALVFNRSDNVTYSGPISGTGSLTNQGGGKLTLNAANTYQGRTTIAAGTLALGPSATLANSAGISVAAGATFDVSAVSGFTLLAGVVNQSLQGSGVVTGSVTCVAGTSLVPGFSVGTLSFSNNLVLNGGTLAMDVGTGSSDLVVVGGNLTLTAGTLQLNLLNTLPNGTYPLIRYGGTLTGTAANLTVAGFSQFGQLAALSSSTPGEIDLVVNTYVSVNLVWQGNGTSNPWDVNTTADWTNSAGAASVFKQFDNANFDDTSANLAVNLATALTPATIGVNAALNNYTFQGNGSLAAGALTKNNNSTLTLLTTNGPLTSTVINGGTVQLGNGVAGGDLGSSTVAVNSSGTLVFAEPGDESSVNVFSGNGNIVQQGPGALTLLANSSLGGALTINGGSVVIGVGGSAGALGNAVVTNNGTLVINRSGSLALNGSMTGGGALIVEGPGTVTLSGVNSYQNNTYISNGVVKLGNSAALPAGGITSGWLILDGGTTAGTLDLNGFNTTVNALSGLAGTASGQIVNNSGSGTNTVAVLETAGTTFAGVILDNTGSGGKVALEMDGPNTLTLQPGGNGSTYSGGTTINNGVISGGSGVTANATMCGTGPVIFGTNGTLQLAGFTGSTTPDYGTFPNPVVIPANMNATVMGTCRGGGFAPSSVSGPASSTLTFVTRYVRGNVAGDWTGFHGLLVVSNNAASANTDFRMNVPLGFPNARMYLAAGGTGGAYMYNLITGTPIIPIGELAGDGSATIALNSGSASGQPALWSVGGLNTSAEYDGGITDSHGIIKVGTGSWTLTSGTLTYTGPTVVSNGVLVLSATAAQPPSSYYTIAAPGKLDVSAATSISVANIIQGDGTLLGSLVANGTVMPGYSNAIGALTVTNTATLSGTTLINVNRTNTPTASRLVANSIALGGNLTVNNLGHTLLGGDTFHLFSGTLTGSFSSTNLPVLAPGLSWVTSALNTSGTLSVVGTIIPPHFSGSPAVAGTSVTLNGTNGLPGGTYYVLGSTNAALPLAQWTALATNVFAGDGSFSFTDTSATNKFQFYDIVEVLP